jgi:hypothetical protein
MIPTMKRTTQPDASSAASVMGKRSAQARIKKWGEQEFTRKMRAWGKLGGRPKGSKNKPKTQSGKEKA